TALAASTAPAILVLDPGDRLAPDAVALLATVLADADLAYGDEDRTDPGGQPVAPALKPDWSPELLRSTPYVGRPWAAWRSVLDAAGGIAAISGDGWEHDLLLRVAEQNSPVVHVAEVLCHRGDAGSAGSGAYPPPGGCGDSRRPARR